MKTYRIEWPAPAGAADEGKMRWVGNYAGVSSKAALTAAKRENRASHGDSAAMRQYRASMVAAKEVRYQSRYSHRAG